MVPSDLLWMAHDSLKNQFIPIDFTPHYPGEDSHLSEFHFRPCQGTVGLNRPISPGNNPRGPLYLKLHGPANPSWRGIIAKGGDAVCRARCVPIGEWIHGVILDVVNFSERTALDLLSKHYHDNATGLNAVIFMASTNLWVDNVSADVTDWELKALFVSYGSVLSVSSFAHRSYAFVHFKEIEAEILAKRRLQGCILRGNPLKIEFSRRQSIPIRPREDFTTHPGNNFGGPSSARLHASYNPHPQALIGGPHWRISCPAPKIRSSASAGYSLGNKSIFEASNVSSSSLLQRVSKRSRFCAASRSPVESDCMWRGIIAKGGGHICRARCVPMGEGIQGVIPEVVNFSERTALDLLRKHYYDNATGFSLVSFVPDSRKDSAKYTSLMQYLGSKDSAGIGKLQDGTLIYLVPPSDFLTNVLQVAGPQRLYGVVFKFPQVV